VLDKKEKEMTQVIGSTKTVLRIACLGVVAAMGSVSLAAAHDLVPPAVPGNLQVPEGHRAYRMTHAVGTQNYICLGAGLAWTFIGPQATGFNEEGGQFMTHFLSPNPVEGGLPRATWQHSKDTSAVWAQAISSSTDPSYVAPGAIPWLLLAVVGTQAGPDEGDKLAATTFIQRVNTVGGVAPAGACPAVGTRAFVPYETDYVFYKAR
jgi:hypothetical protein